MYETAVQYSEEATGRIGGSTAEPKSGNDRIRGSSPDREVGGRTHTSRYKIEPSYDRASPRADARSPRAGSLSLTQSRRGLRFPIPGTELGRSSKLFLPGA